MPAPAWMLVAIASGFAFGALFSRYTGPATEGFRLVGGLWIDSLRMTILPLVFALVVTGVADLATRGDNAARRIGRRLPMVLVGILLLAAILAALIVPPLLATFRLAPEVAAAFRSSVPPTTTPAVPSIVDTIRTMVPVNVVASAAQGAIVPLVVFALVLGFALSRVERTRAVPTLDLFRGIADAMIVIVGWVLRLAPLGIFSLAFVIGATAGIGAAIALGQYILIQIIVAVALMIISYLLVPLFTSIALTHFVRAVAPAQAIAAGTQSSIATLPAMLACAERLGVPSRQAAVILSLSVAVFKVTAPTGTLIFGLSAAWLAGVEVPVSQVIVAIPMSLLSTLLVLGVPGPASIIAAATPTAIALGAPLEMIPILLAVDTIPDMFRTMANVTADIAATAIIAAPSSEPEIAVETSG
jgi:proton glutamate symport protein